MQTHYYNYGAPLAVEDERTFRAFISAIGVYDGFDVTATGPEEITVAPGNLLFPSGIGMSEDTPQTLDFQNPGTPTVFTVLWQHTDDNFIGGTDAKLSIVVGKLVAPADGVVVGYIKHPGTGVLAQSMVVGVAKMRAPDLVAAQQDRRARHYLPPFPEAINVPIPAEALLAGVVSPDGDVLYCAVVPGPSSVQVRHVVAGNNTPLSCTVLGAQITVNLATNGSGVAVTNAATVAALVSATGLAAALVFARVGGTGLGLAAASGFTTLSGGFLAQGANCSAALRYAREIQRSALVIQVGPGAVTTENYLLLLRCTATEVPPRRLTLSVNIGTGAALAILVRDTVGQQVTISPSSIGPTAGWLDVDIDLAGGTFLADGDWFLQLRFSGTSVTVQQLAAIKVLYDADAVV